MLPGVRFLVISFVHLVSGKEPSYYKIHCNVNKKFSCSCQLEVLERRGRESPLQSENTAD